jgi:Ca2+/H+ antiporter, TMEM165/GDT1 family
MDWGAWFSAFGLIFIAELGDKTQLAVVTQTCKFRRPWPIFLGGSLALTAVTALGAAGGRVLNAFIPQDVIRSVAGLAFVVMGSLIWREALRADEREACDRIEAGECALELASKEPSAWIPFTGGAAALVAVTAIGVLGGEKLCQWIPERLLLRISAAAFVVMGALMGVGIL